MKVRQEVKEEKKREEQGRPGHGTARALRSAADEQDADVRAAQHQM
jgi:hypothetical protein